MCGHKCEINVYVTPRYNPRIQAEKLSKYAVYPQIEMNIGQADRYIHVAIRPHSAGWANADIVLPNTKWPGLIQSQCI
jgi:hypothetical protein